MNSLIKFITTALTKSSTTISPNIRYQLGRWNVEYCQEILNRKIYLANQDNCGASGNCNTISLNLALKK